MQWRDGWEACDIFRMNHQLQHFSWRRHRKTRQVFFSSPPLCINTERLIRQKLKYWQSGEKEERPFKDHLQKGSIQQLKETFKENRSKGCWDVNKVCYKSTTQLKEALELNVWERPLMSNYIAELHSDGWFELADCYEAKMFHSWKWSGSYNHAATQLDGGSNWWRDKTTTGIF